MKQFLRLLALALLASGAAFAQSDITGSAQLTSTCANVHSTCDTAGVTIFNPGSSFDVQGPQTIEVTTQGYGLAQVSATGTYTGSTVFFEFSDDGGSTWYSDTCTRTDIGVQEVSEALPSNGQEAWDCGVGAATKFRVRQSAISTGGPSIRVTLTTGLLEPAPTVGLQALAYTPITTATNTQLKSTPSYLHTVTITQPGATANSITVVDTTNSNCTGGTTIATIPSAQLVSALAPMTLTFDIQTNNGLCVITAGTTSPQLVLSWR